MDLDLFDENRTIEKKRVKESYNLLKSKGFIKEVGMIEYVTGSCLEGKKILSARIEKEDDEKSLSLKNWKLVMEEVPYTPDIKVCIDGQGRLIALMLMKMIDGDNTIDDDNIYKEVTVPEGMNVTELTLLKNSGAPWGYKDVYNTNLSSGNTYIDTLDELSKQYNVIQKAVYDFGTLSTGDLTCADVKKMKIGTEVLSHKVTLDDNSIDVANKILETIKDNQTLTIGLITAKFSKGLKMFFKACNISDYDDVYGTIRSINKDIWERYFTPECGTTAEGGFYSKAFKSAYDEYMSTEELSTQQA